MRLIDVTGQRFGRLLVLRKGPISKNGGSLWVCACDCGTEVTINASNLRNGATNSCGCLGREWSRHLGSHPEYVAKRAAKMVKHGHKRRGQSSPEYKTWLGIKRRCSDVKHPDFAYYGGRGIRVCERWDFSFEAFLVDMGTKPSPKLTIDRLDSNGNYEPSNCRWVPHCQQAAENRRGLIPVVIGGVTFASLKAACRAYGTPYTAAIMRIADGHDAITAITTPLRGLPNRRTRESYLPKSRRAA